MEEILEYVRPCQRILLVGCNECVTVCAAGGRKEVGLLSSALQMAAMKEGRTLEVKEITLERQCDPEYVEELASQVGDAEAIVSMACGCGVQELARRYKSMRVYPAVNTKFMGASERQGVWAERCQGCGDCLLGITGGVCPIARCSKQLMNGPCGGSTKGKCEISQDVDCAWQLIWDRLKALGVEDRYEENIPAKDWRTGRGGGPRKIIREDLAQ
jgi:ferredoxin